jgi:uncharacterized protein (TIGR02145 family)
MNRCIFPLLIICTFIAQQSTAQVVEITGQAKVSTMLQDDTQDNLVVRRPDGTLGTRAASSLPASFIDTNRTLNTDLELAKMLCDCPNLPPFLIDQLRDAGYSLENLARAGVPYDNLKHTFPVSDGSGIEYDYITIGNQRWLSSNLRTQRYNNGDFISTLTTDQSWIDANTNETPGLCWYENDQFANEIPYGALYNWFVIDSASNGGRNVCPIGWKIPTEEDIDTLLNTLQQGVSFGLDLNTVGKLLKTTGTDYWYSNVSNNVTGFSFPGGGYRINSSGQYVFQKTFGRFWTKDSASANNATSARFRSLNPGFDKGADSKGTGISIRCMQRVN